MPKLNKVAIENPGSFKVEFDPKHPSLKGIVHEPLPIEVYGMGTVQKIRDEVCYLESKMEAVVHSNHRVEDALNKLVDELATFTGVVEEIRDILKKRLSSANNDVPNRVEIVRSD
jgi:hypothetical protein